MLQVLYLYIKPCKSVLCVHVHIYLHVCISTLILICMYVCSVKINVFRAYEFLGLDALIIFRFICVAIKASRRMLLNGQLGVSLVSVPIALSIDLLAKCMKMPYNKLAATLMWQLTYVWTWRCWFRFTRTTIIKSYSRLGNAILKSQFIFQ